MAGNRVEDLEAKVRELEATIDGLTDELVETKERLEAVEAETGVDDDLLGSRTGRSATRRTQRNADDDADESTADDQVEAGADGAEASADEVNTEGTNEEDDADSESGDDIIVA